MQGFYTSLLQQVKTIGQSVFLGIDHTSYACLYDEF